MSTRMMKVLGATTAFVAATGIAQAQTYDSTTAVTAGLTQTTSASGVMNISGSQVVSVSSGPAISVSGTGSPVLGISSSAVVKSDNVNGVIVVGERSNLADFTINNSGTITALGQNGYAISATNSAQSATALSVRNTGTISGSIATTTGTLTYVGTGSGSVTGNLTSGAGTGTTDAVTLENSARITGNVSLGAGTNNLTISGTSARLNGNYTGTGGVDTLTLNNGGVISGTVDVGAGANVISLTASSMISGSVTASTNDDTLTLTNGATIYGATDLSDGNNVVTINNSTLKVNTGTALTLGSGNDQVTVSGTGIVSGAMAFGGGTDVMFAYGSNYSTGGAITGLEQIQVSGTTTLNHFVTGLTSANIGAGSTLNANERFAVGGTLTNNGTFHLTSGTVNLTDYTGGTGSHLIMNLANQSSATQIALTNGANLANTSLTVIAPTNSGFIASGTQYVLIDGGATSALPTTFLASNTGVYRYALDRINTNQDIRLTVGRVSTSSVVTGATQKAIADALDQMATLTTSGTLLVSTSALYKAQSLIGSQSTAAGVQNVIESLSPNIDGIGAASIGVNVATGNQISNRLASLRSTSAMSGVATGNAAASRHMWVEGFGNTTEQDDNKGLRGYDANSAGASFGFDTEELVQGYTTGAAFSYANGTVDSNAFGGASTDVDTYVATLYGSRVLDNGMFVNAQANLGMSNYDTERTVAGIGRATADFDGWQAGLKGEVGKDMPMGALTLTPLASLQYSYLDVDSYTETGLAGASLVVNPESMSALDAGVGAQVAHTMPLQNGGTLKPTAHAKYIYRMGDAAMDTTSRFTGGGASFATSGVKADRSSVNLGAGLLLTTAGGVDFSVNYDADIRESLTGHTGQLKARWAF